MKAVVDQDACVGLGCCERVCPRVFKLENGVASVRVDTVDPRDEDRCRDAEFECPTGAIYLVH